MHLAISLHSDYIQFQRMTIDELRETVNAFNKAVKTANGRLKK